MAGMPGQRLPPDVVPRLASPPRHVPLGTRIRLLLGGFGIVAWLWFGGGSALAMFFLRSTDLGAAARFSGELVHAAGTSTGCEQTSASEGGSKHRRGTPIFATRYTFEAGGETRSGVSYAVGVCREQGEAVVVEYPAGHPETSRIAGMRTSLWGPGVAFVAIFPVVGLVLLAFSLREGRRQLHLVESGRLALGTLTSREATRTKVNNRRVMKYRFLIETGAGMREEVTIRTHRLEPVEDGARELVVYDPEDASRAAAWRLLTSVPRIDMAGQLEAPGAFVTLLLLLPPAAALAAILAVVMH